MLRCGVSLQGVPEAPMCGFSNMACRILDAYGRPSPSELHLTALLRLLPCCATRAAGLGFRAAALPSNRPASLLCAEVDFGSSNVLSDPELREGIKKYTHWPTIPQAGVQQELGGAWEHGGQTWL
jgi:glutaredoxin-related protein